MNFLKSGPLQHILARTGASGFSAPWRWNETAKTKQPLLPVDLLLLIADALPLHGQLFFSQTCHVIRIILPRLRDSGRHLPREQALDYLTVLAHDKLERWACDLCTKLHSVHTMDIPKYRVGYLKACPEVWRLSHAGLFTHNIDHRHVQLALKYTRMELANKKHRQYLKDLLAPHHVNYDVNGWPSDVKSDLQLSSYSKIANGRYLLLSVLQFKMNKKPVTPFTIGRRLICRHQQLRPIEYYRPSELGELVRHGSQDPEFKLWRAVGTAFEMEGAEVTDSCPLCPMDFLVQASPERVTLQVWHDLGPEGSPLDQAWRIHSYHFTEKWRNDTLPYQEFGSIRRAYELG
ncbi:hypothetical protein QQX98_005719 [Neonectria punicea]|uniref:F-box domain-containing protein n=1 Tax=Neonectria punicea TaxID=979145 RepID=A0ABR1H419_9HYPO